MQNIFTYLAKRVEETRKYYKAIEELSQLSDRELADIGLNRGEIHMVAMTVLNRK